MNTIEKRLEALRENMRREKIDCYLIFTSDYHQSEYVDNAFKTREFLSGFTGSAGWMAVTGSRAILWADGRYHVQAAEQLAGTTIELFKDGLPETPTIEEFLKEEITAGMTVACDGRTISATYCNELLNAISPGKFRTDIDLFEKVWTQRPKMNANPVHELPLLICGMERSEKIRNIRSKLKETGADAYVLTDLSAVMWLFNLRGSDVTYNPVAFSYAYISMMDAVLFVQDQALSDVLRLSLRSDGITCLPYGEFENYLSSLKSLTIALDPNACNSVICSILQDGNSLLSVSDHDLIPKQIKNEAEIRLAKKYHEYDAVAMIRFIRYIKDTVAKEEITECEAAAYIDRLRSENEGYVDLSFETICAYGSNGAIIHYAPKEDTCAVLKPEGFLLLDSGAQYRGATTDITRTIALGPLKEEEKIHYTAVLKSMIALADAVFMKGCTGVNLDILAREPIWRIGLDYRHGTGHGIGAFLNVHEGPQSFRIKILKDQIPPMIVPGMITSDEPGIYIEGSHGIRIENELLCVEKLQNEWGEYYGFETLTLVPYEKDAIIREMLTQRETEWINTYYRTVYEKISPYLTDEEKEWLKEATDPV
ncbi:MAG: aminopeptidase P family protein [Lachnospiraceae bacterium]|nr:aminopeptidase P family protein [Lachnospiraceae bacterium]